MASSSGSIVYVLDGDIWIAAPDGSAARQLTRDGTTEAYHDPSQADDGSIFALRGNSTLVHLDRAGQPIGSPVSLITLENGAGGLAGSPDGQHIAYVTTGFGTEIDPRFGTPVGTFIYGGTDVATPDGMSVPGAALASMLYPGWLGNDRLVLADGVNVYTASVGAEAETWITRDEGCLIEFDCPSGDPAQASLSIPAVNRNGTVLAYNTNPFFGPGGRVMAELEAAPPAAPVDRCLVEAHVSFNDTGSFRPDGGAYAFDDAQFDRDTFEETEATGVYVMDVDLGAPDCGASAARLIAAGGSQPDWGPAAP
jgi:hypothetical protein